MHSRISRWNRVAVVLVGFMAAGCFVAGGSIVTEPPQPTVVVIGRFAAGPTDAADPVMCEWLEDDNGNRTFVIYPTGWDVAYEPLRLLDGGGRVIAREGDKIRVTGRADDFGVSLCAPGKPLSAETVEVLAD
jgi:hypothetical protein